MIHFTPKENNALYVNQITPFIEEANKSMVDLNLVSQEAIRNQQGESRINIRFDGRISDHIEDIFKDFLKCEKELHIDETSNNYNFIGNGRKAFYTLNWLSKMGIPDTDKAEGNTAGFFFWETSEGFKFKAIDTLLDKTKNPQKKSIIFNQTFTMFIN